MEAHQKMLQRVPLESTHPLREAWPKIKEEVKVYVVRLGLNGSSINLCRLGPDETGSSNDIVFLLNLPICYEAHRDTLISLIEESMSKNWASASPALKIYSASTERQSSVRYKTRKWVALRRVHPTSTVAGDYYVRRAIVNLFLGFFSKLVAFPLVGYICRERIALKIVVIW